MFDRIMENSMALWMLVSALFPIFFFGTLIKAALHFRRMRELNRLEERLVVRLENRLERRLENRLERLESEDWIPSR
jgi:hypothetical protein